jgi:hypothetical protein
MEIVKIETWQLASALSYLKEKCCDDVFPVKDEGSSNPL